MKRRIAVFGGSGFIGSRLVTRLLERGEEVRIADVRRSEWQKDIWVQCDIRDPDAVRAVARGCDVIYNLAAEHLDDVTPRRLYDEVNVDGSRSVCAAADDLGIDRIVFTSSVAIYGLPRKEASEESEARPFNDYGRAKLKAEEVYREWQRRNPGCSLTIVRPTAVFGEHNRANVYNLMTQIAKGRFIMIGSGRNRKSIAYVENVAAFLVHCLENGPGLHLFNYADKPDLEMNALVAAIRSHLGQASRREIRLPYAMGYVLGLMADVIAFVIRRKLPFSAVRVLKFCANTQFSAQKVAAAGFKPPFTLEEGLRRTVGFEFGERH